MTTIHILGRTLTFSLPMRMAREETPIESEFPLYIVNNNQDRREEARHKQLSEAWNTAVGSNGEGVENWLPPGVNPARYKGALAAAKEFALRAAAAAKVSGKVHAISSQGAHPWWRGGKSVFVADPEGNVTHHHHYPGSGEGAVPGKTEGEDGPASAHHAAVAAGFPFAKFKFNSPHAAEYYAKDTGGS